jgi:ABC-type uncharacterized transport system auxiliary subunit
MSALKRRAVLGSSVALAGCSVLPQRPYQERREWPLDVQRPTTLPPNPNGPVLLVRALRGGPGLDDRGLRTLRADGAAHTDYWEEWAVPPPQGVEDDMRQWLAASGKFSAVVMAGSDMRADLVLEGELLALVADLGRGQARASLGIVLLRRIPGAYQPLLQRSFTGTAPLTGQDGPALAASMRQALTAVLDQIEAALPG